MFCLPRKESNPLCSSINYLSYLIDDWEILLRGSIVAHYRGFSLSIFKKIEEKRLICCAWDNLSVLLYFEVSFLRHALSTQAGIFFSSIDAGTIPLLCLMSTLGSGDGLLYKKCDSQSECKYK